MGISARTAWALGASILLVAACGGSDTPSTAAPSSPADPPVPAAEAAPRSTPELEDAPGTGPQPPPAASPEPSAERSDEPRTGSGGRVGADLADVLPTVSTMAASSTPLPPEAPAGTLEGIEGVVAVPVESVDHVRYDVEYPTAPPAGGPHLGIWLNCGFYTVPVLDELAVHSLEHGAVWVTYRSDVPAESIRQLAARAVQSTHLLVSPYEAQRSPLVLSAWARQLALDSLEDPRFERFLEVYLRDGPTAPEPGASCSGAVGVPPDHPEAVPQQG